MRVNYHTHTPRCGHAKGTDREYIESAIAGGIEVLGFSEHCTYLMYPEATEKPHLTQQMLPGYVNEIRETAQAYKNEITVHVGAEVEYYPATHRERCARLRDAGVEYLLLGQHFLDSPVHQRTRNAIYDPAILEHYCDQVIEGMQTGNFSYVCHPDCILFLGDRKLLKEQLRRICVEAKSCGLPLEINLNGIFKNQHYPCRELFELAAEEGNTVILGADAHTPDRFTNHDAEKKALELIKQYALSLVETVPFQPF